MAYFQTDIAMDSDIRIKNGQRMWLRLSLLYKLCLHHHLLKLILKLQTIKNRSSKLRTNKVKQMYEEDEPWHYFKHAQLCTQTSELQLDNACGSIYLSAINFVYITIFSDFSVSQKTIETEFRFFALSTRPRR